MVVRGVGGMHLRCVHVRLGMNRLSRGRIASWGLVAIVVCAISCMGVRVRAVDGWTGMSVGSYMSVGTIYAVSLVRAVTVDKRVMSLSVRRWNGGMR